MPTQNININWSKIIKKVKILTLALINGFKWLLAKLLILVKGQPASKLNIPTACPKPIEFSSSTLALVLSGGASRGAAHAGVIDVLKSEGIQPDFVVGTSAGSLIGALYCDAPDSGPLKSTVLNAYKKDFFDPNIWAITRSIIKLSGLSQGQALQNFIGKNVQAEDFDALALPLVVVTYDLLKCERYCIRSGPLAPALLASSCVPIMYQPVEMYGRCLVDGGIVDPLNIDIAYQLGAKNVIAVDLNQIKPVPIRKNLDVYRQVMWATMHALASKEVDGTPLLLKPDFNNNIIFGDRHLSEHYAAGAQAALSALSQIKQLT